MSSQYGAVDGEGPQKLYHSMHRVRDIELDSPGIKSGIVQILGFKTKRKVYIHCALQRLRQISLLSRSNYIQKIQMMNLYCNALILSTHQTLRLVMTTSKIFIIHSRKPIIRAASITQVNKVTTTSNQKVSLIGKFGLVYKTGK